MEKKREPLRYRPVAEADGKLWRDVGGLDEMKDAGCYIVQLRHGSESNQLPLEPCDDEHYIVATLIVTESGTADMLQKNRMIGQTLIMPDCDDGRTRIFNRTLRTANQNSTWNSWNNIAQTGVDNEITSTEELVASVTELVSETSNIRAALDTEKSTRETVDEGMKKRSVLVNSLRVDSSTSGVEITYSNVSGTEVQRVEIPAATEIAAGVMSALDKARLEYMSLEIGIIVKNALLKNGTELPALLKLKGKEVYFMVEPTNVNGAVAFYDENDKFLGYILNEGYETIPVNASKIAVAYGDVVATIMYEPNVPSNIVSKIRSLSECVGEIKDNIGFIEEFDITINGGTSTAVGDVIYNALGKYIDGSTVDGRIFAYTALSLAYYKVEEGVTYDIHIPHSCNSAGWLLGYSDVADGVTKVTILKEYGKGSDTLGAVDIQLVSTYTGFLAVGYNTGSELPTVTYIQQNEGLVKDVEYLKENISSVKKLNRSIMFFGDSLTSASTTGVVGFAKLLAEDDGVPYRAFLYDRADGNTSDVDVDYPCYTNYGKDGTTNKQRTDRVGDSVIERIKRHVTPSVNVDVVLVECCVNDLGHLDTIGAISESYTNFDETTTIGAIEECCRYLSTLDKKLTFGFYIPWNISYGDYSLFDDYIAVFKKWGVPYLDLRETAGFEMRKCIEHRRLYSLPSRDYSEYDAATTYNLDDKVRYNGFLYKCNNDGVLGIEPTNEEYWTKLTSGSFDGCHLNSLGHYVVKAKIKDFIDRL